MRPSPPRPERAIAALLVLCFLVPALSAQRGKPEFEWSGTKLVLDHGKPRWGRHSLDELAPGASWRLGSNEASTLLVELPLLAGRQLVAPGHYRVQLRRPQSGDRWLIQVDYGGWALADGPEAAYLPATLADAEPTKALEIAWERRAGADRPRADGDRKEDRTASASPNAELALVARFGPHRIGAPLTVFGARAARRVGKFQLTAYTIPADVLDARVEADRPTVIASLRPRSKVSGQKAPPFFNVVVGKRSVELVPALRAPVDSFGFGELRPYAESWTGQGELEWIDKDAGVSYLEVTEAAIARKRLSLTFVCGQRIGAVSVPLPHKPK